MGSTSKLRWSLKTEHDKTTKKIFPGSFVFEPQERCLFLILHWKRQAFRPWLCFARPFVPWRRCRMEGTESFDRKMHTAKVEFEHLLYRTHVIDLSWCVFLSSIFALVCGKSGVLKNSACVFGLFANTGSAFGESRGLHYFFKHVCFCLMFLILLLEATPFTSSWIHILLLFACFLSTMGGFCNLSFDLLRQNVSGNCCMSLRSGFNFHLCHTSFIQMFSALYSKRWEIVRQCFKNWTLNMYRMTQTRIVQTTAV